MFQYFLCFSLENLRFCKKLRKTNPTFCARGPPPCGPRARSDGNEYAGSPSGGTRVRLRAFPPNRGQIEKVFFDGEYFYLGKNNFSQPSIGKVLENAKKVEKIILFS